MTQYNGNSAARVMVRDGVITDFELWLRSYSLGSEATALLPVAQAAAAVTALGEDGGELLLCYYDLGGDTVRAGWAITR